VGSKVLDGLDGRGGRREDGDVGDLRGGRVSAGIESKIGTWNKCRHVCIEIWGRLSQPSYGAENFLLVEVGGNRAGGGLEFVEAVTVGFGASGVDHEVAFVFDELLEGRDSCLSVFVLVNSGVEVEVGVSNVELPWGRGQNVYPGACWRLCC
jgi:hypothetical protein